MEPFLGQIQAFGFNFAPRGWAKCEGQLISIPENTALFSLLGTMYGGDGRTTFGLPDLRGRMPMGTGNGPALTPRPVGKKGGQETNTLSALNLPAHNHQIKIAAEGNTDDPVNNYIAGSGINSFSTTAADKNSRSTESTGGDQPIDNMPPYLPINYCIAVVGIFPSRN